MRGTMVLRKLPDCGAARPPFVDPGASPAGGAESRAPAAVSASNNSLQRTAVRAGRESVCWRASTRLRASCCSNGCPRSDRSARPKRGWQRCGSQPCGAQALRRGTFVSVNHLIARIRDYVKHWNANAEPFVWIATAEEILTKVRLVQTNVKKLVQNNAK